MWDGLADWLVVVVKHLSLGGWFGRVRFRAAHPVRARRIVLNTPGGTTADPNVMEEIRTLSLDAADDPAKDRVRARVAGLITDPVTATDGHVDVRSIIARGTPRPLEESLCTQDPQVRRRNMATDRDPQTQSRSIPMIWRSHDLSVR